MWSSWTQRFSPRRKGSGTPIPIACLAGLVCTWGQTGKTPEQRYEDHKRGYKSNKYAEKYGIRLALEFLERANPMTYEESCAEEERLGTLLRQLGYATWWN